MTTYATKSIGKDFACVLVFDITTRRYHVNSIYLDVTKHLLESDDLDFAKCYFDGLVDGVEMISK